MPKWWKSPRVWFFVLLIFGVGAAATLCWFLAVEGRDNADKWASIIFGATAATAVLAGGLRWLWQQEPGQAAGTVTPERLTAARESLARAQVEQWTAEEVARQIQDPWPLRVRWQVSRRARLVMVSWASVRGVPDAGEIPLEGTYDRVAEVFDHPDSPRRLVVLGEPGAGKSMLVLRLTLELLQRRGEQDPVPVLLPVAGWDPAQPLDEWIATRLATDHRFVAGKVETSGGGRRTLARELVARGMILPVLDGLDEIGPARHSPALVAIASAAGTGGSFVLTSRTRAYERAVHDSSPLARTPVVELQPLTADDAARYLVDGTDQPRPRWDPVLAQLAANADTPLVQTLSTPLMIWLARVVYQHRGSDPGELLTAAWAQSRDGIEKHLLHRLVPAAYAAAIGGHPGRTPAEARKAQRWLTTLARHLKADRTYDLAWWRLNEIAPGPAAQAVTVVWTGTATLVAVTMAMFGVFVAQYAAEIAPQPAWLWSGLGAGLAVGIASGLVRRLFQGQSYPRRVRFTLSPGAWLAIGGSVGLIPALLGEPLAGVVGTLTAGISAPLVAGGTQSHGEDHRALSPRALLLEDRNAALVAGATCVPYAALLTIAAGFPAGLEIVDLIFLLILCVLIGGGAIALSAWGQFCVARVVLAVCRRTPLRLMRFLGEAHDRGVLRQAGGIYQFRHNLLQDHLAAAPTGSAGPAAP
ncbi:NACHT domain-containing protein [Actinoplanes sp. NPDC049599]|uniref:NACHT domain-containing protein n=1 Tax=Actinoplanes sp. NPDC049599 TaxID=3363903 RepID=UPI0037A8F742